MRSWPNGQNSALALFRATDIDAGPDLHGYRLTIDHEIWNGQLTLVAVVVRVIPPPSPRQHLSESRRHPHRRGSSSGPGPDDERQQPPSQSRLRCLV